MSILSDYSPRHEVYSIDECFVDLTGTPKLREISYAIQAVAHHSLDGHRCPRKSSALRPALKAVAVLTYPRMISFFAVAVSVYFAKFYLDLPTALPNVY